MKNIEELERLGIEELISNAESNGAPVPANIEKKLLASLTAYEFNKSRKVHHKRLKYAAIGLAIASLSLIFILPQQPQDTFDDPLLAYAEVQRTFSYISSKIEHGADIASEAETILSKTKEIFK